MTFSTVFLEIFDLPSFTGEPEGWARSITWPTQKPWKRRKMFFCGKRLRAECLGDIIFVARITEEGIEKCRVNIVSQPDCINNIPWKSLPSKAEFKRDYSNLNIFAWRSCDPADDFLAQRIACRWIGCPHVTVDSFLSTICDKNPESSKIYHIIVSIQTLPEILILRPSLFYLSKVICVGFIFSSQRCRYHARSVWFWPDVFRLWCFRYVRIWPQKVTLVALMILIGIHSKFEFLKEPRQLIHFLVKSSKPLLRENDLLHHLYVSIKIEDICRGI